MPSIEELSVSTMVKGSKTFSLAARFFEKEQFLSAAKIYSWCRYCDDAIDESPATLHTLREISDKTFNPVSGPEFAGFQAIRAQYQIPEFYPRELLAGMEMDLNKNYYTNFDELKLYCFRVAGTVGLMMSHVMGLFDERALSHAAKLGMAMQLSNIARDVKEDYQRGRIYLPQEWLSLAGINPGELLQPSQKNKLRMVVKRLLGEAEILYQEGSEGVIYLPFRSAIAVTMARNLYREIGREVLRRHNDFPHKRIVISSGRKMVLSFLALMEVMLSLPRRIFHPDKPVTIQTVWRPV
jgi:15-cis-phytoene synthase